MRYNWEIKTKNASLKESGSFSHYADCLQMIRNRQEKVLHAHAEPILPVLPEERLVYIEKEASSMIEEASLKEIYHAIAWFRGQAGVATPWRNPVTHQLDRLVSKLPLEWEAPFKHLVVRMLRARKKALL